MLHIANPALQECFQRALLKRLVIRIYTTDNGGTPFCVRVQRASHGLLRALVVARKSCLIVPKVNEVWYGCGSYDNPRDVSSEHFVGNTVLLVTDSHYYSVAGSTVLQFKRHKGETVKEYVSTLGNSAVPYGHLVTSRGLYMISGFSCVSAPVYSEKPCQPVLFVKSLSDTECEDPSCCPRRGNTAAVSVLQASDRDPWGYFDWEEVTSRGAPCFVAWVTTETGFERAAALLTEVTESMSAPPKNLWQRREAEEKPKRRLPVRRPSHRPNLLSKWHALVGSIFKSVAPRQPDLKPPAH